MIRLRRSDFSIWDYHKRATWRSIKHAMLDPDEPEVLAWAMKRASSRAVYVLVHKAKFLSCMIAIGYIAKEAESYYPWHARVTLDRIKRVMTKDETEFMRDIARTSPSS